jgi:chromosome condensin MukBEF MukE localization factor
MMVVMACISRLRFLGFIVSVGGEGGKGFVCDSLLFNAELRLEFLC